MSADISKNRPKFQFSAPAATIFSFKFRSPFPPPPHFSKKQHFSAISAEFCGLWCRANRDSIARIWVGLQLNPLGLDGLQKPKNRNWEPKKTPNLLDHPVLPLRVFGRFLFSEPPPTIRRSAVVTGNSLLFSSLFRSVFPLFVSFFFRSSTTISSLSTFRSSTTISSLSRSLSPPV